MAYSWGAPQGSITVLLRSAAGLETSTAATALRGWLFSCTSPEGSLKMVGENLKNSQTPVILYGFYLGYFFPTACKIYSQPSFFPGLLSGGPKKAAKTTEQKQVLPSQVRAGIILKSGKGYLNTLAEQAAETVHWICRFCWEDGQGRAQSCVLRL